MASNPDPALVDDSDDEFARHFNEIAAGKTAPASEEPDEPAEPEGNAPAEEEGSAPEGAPPAEAETGTSGDEASAPEQEAQAEAPDIWANAPEELRAEFARIQKERNEFEQRARADAGRVAALSRKLQTLTNGDAPKKEASPEGSKAKDALDDKIKDLRENYGAIADPLIELIERQAEELASVKTVATRITEESQAAEIAAQAAALDARHPDWREIAVNPDFAAWREAQPANIQALANSWDARETSVVLTLYKAERMQAAGFQPEGQQAPKPEDDATSARRSRQLDGGRDVRSRPAPAASGPPEDFDSAFSYYAQKRQQTQAARR